MARILLADDEDGLRTLFGMWLSTSGHEVTEARDGEEAARMLADQAYDLAVIDLLMPRLDGISVIKSLRAGRPEAKVLAISAGNAEMPAGVGLPLSAMFGADEVLYKPFNRSEFLGVVDRLLA